jgi:nucleotide-binding universal stress UspA family protein
VQTKYSRKKEIIMFDKILLAVDGSEHALHAARQAAQLARTMGSKEVRIVVAYDPIPMYLGEPNLQFAINARMDEAKAILQNAVKEVGELPCAVHTELIEGDPAAAIIDVANTRQSDVIVIGSRGLGTLAGLLLGSTSQKVVAHAPCPVLIVR